MNNQALDCFTKIDFINPAAKKFLQPQEMLNILQLVLGVAVQCDDKEDFINEILHNHDEAEQTELMRIIQLVLQRYAPENDSMSKISDQSNFDSNQMSNNDNAESDLQPLVQKLELENKKYLKTINDLDQENSSLKQSYETTLREKEELQKKVSDHQKMQLNYFKKTTLDDLIQEHGDIEAKLGRVRELEGKLEMQSHQMYEYEKNFERLKKDFGVERQNLTEELEIEREKSLQMQKSEIQMQVYKKKLENYNEMAEKVQEQETMIKDLKEQAYQMENELKQKRHIDEAVKFLKEEVGKEKSKITQLELQLQSKDHSIKDLQSQLKISKKKEELNQQKVTEMELEIEELRNADNQLYNRG